MDSLAQLILTLVLLAFKAYVAHSPVATPPDYYPVVSVTDGDTFKIDLNQQIETVRVVGIDTPETVDPRRPVQCFGQEASAKMSELLSPGSVRLVADPTQSDRDRYHRLLRFVFLPDGTDVGLELIRQGFAQSVLYSDSPHPYYSAYEQAETSARNAQIGLWNPNACKME